MHSSENDGGKRTYRVPLSLTLAELEAVKAAMPDGRELAAWLREVVLQHVRKSPQATGGITVDLLRQTAAWIVKGLSDELSYEGFLAMYDEMVLNNKETADERAHQ